MTRWRDRLPPSSLLNSGIQDRYQERPVNTFGTWLGRLALLTTGGMLLAILLGGISLWQSGSRLLAGIGTWLSTPQPPPQVDVRSTIVHQLRDASELTTAVLAMEAVVPTSRDRTVGEFVIGTTKLLYIAYGEVRAGVDLSQLQAQDVRVVNDTVYIRLPQPQILDSKIDVARSNIYDYNRGFLGLGPDAAPELMMLAENTALQKIQAAACTNRLLEQANTRAQTVVSQLLNPAGYPAVIVETQAPSPQACATPGLAGQHPLHQPSAIGVDPPVALPIPDYGVRQNQ